MPTSSLVLLVLALVVFKESVCQPQGVIDHVPVIMLGYDVVAYHFNVTGCNSIKGKKEYSYRISSRDGNGIYRLYDAHFADENNLNIFSQNPWRYLPRFGGFCSWGTCCEKPPSWPWSANFLGPPGGPDNRNCGFRVHTDGYLYFNIWKSYDNLFFSNAAANIAAGKERWIKWFGSLEAGILNFHCFSTRSNQTIYDCVDNGSPMAPVDPNPPTSAPVSYPIPSPTNMPTKSPSPSPTLPILDHIPLVLLGYDVVAYHLNVTGCDSIKGTSQHMAYLDSRDENGILRRYKFYFADENNKRIFENNPWRYAPRFGGFCSYGTCCEKQSQGWPWAANFQGPPAGPDKRNCGFRVHTDGYLYFNIWKSYDTRFFNNAEANIAAGKQRWIEWYGSLEAGPFNFRCFSTSGNSTINKCVSSPAPRAPAVETTTTNSPDTSTTSVSPDTTTSSPDTTTSSPDTTTSSPVTTSSSPDTTIKPKTTVDPHVHDNSHTTTSKPHTTGNNMPSKIPVVMLGYDIVAYHFNVTGCNSIKGTKEHIAHLASADSDGIYRWYEFWFADENNKKIFQSNPWRYAPRFGGFCSYGTCCELSNQGWPWAADFQGPPAGPDKHNCGFRIHTDGYLYFNIWKYYDTRFFNNAQSNIDKGISRWIGWYGSLKAGPFNTGCFSTSGNDTINKCVNRGQGWAPPVVGNYTFTTGAVIISNTGYENYTFTTGAVIISNTLSDKEKSSSDSSNMKVVEIVGIVILAFVVVTIILLSIYLYRKFKNKGTVMFTSETLKEDSVSLDKQDIEGDTQDTTNGDTNTSIKTKGNTSKTTAHYTSVNSENVELEPVR